jgi:FkbM family methyltransferase
MDLSPIREQEGELFYEIFSLNMYNVVPEEIKDATVIDIGGNHGIFSMFSIVHGAKQCYCIEPDKTNYQILLKNIEAFPNITPFNLAVSKPGLKQAHIMFDNCFCQVYEEGEGELVNCISLEEFIENEIPFSNNDLVLKIDCEGSEYDIIFPCPIGTLRRFKYIYAEVHNEMHSNKNYNHEMFIDFMHNIGFVGEQGQFSAGMWFGDCYVLKAYMIKFTRINSIIYSNPAQIIT